MILDMVIKLTPEGINLLERKIIEAFVENPDEIRETDKILNINLNQLLQKYLKRYLQIEEDLLRIRSGMEPKYNSIEYYAPKSKKRSHLAD